MLNVRWSVIVLHYFTIRALTRSGCNWLPPPLSLRFTVQFCSQPGGRVRRVPPPNKCEFVCLQKIYSLAGPPPFICSNVVEVPHPNATNTISIPAGTQAPGVPSGNFVGNPENPPQIAGPGRTGNQNRCCFFSSLIKISPPFPLPLASCVLTPRTLQRYRRQAWVANSGNPRFTTSCCLNEFSDPSRHQPHRLSTCRWGRNRCRS